MHDDLLLHVCCAPCILRTQANLTVDVFTQQIIPAATLYFDNPNISPRSEWDRRHASVTKLATKLDLPLITADYLPQDFFTLQKNLYITGKIHDRGARCSPCLSFRLEKAAHYAKEHGFTRFGSTLASSLNFAPEQINTLGKNIAKKYQLEWLSLPQKTIEVSTVGYYQQSYCGCPWSLLERVEEKHYANNEAAAN